MSFFASFLDVIGRFTEKFPFYPTPFLPLQKATFMSCLLFSSGFLASVSPPPPSPYILFLTISYIVYRYIYIVSLFPLRKDSTSDISSTRRESHWQLLINTIANVILSFFTQGTSFLSQKNVLDDELCATWLEFGVKVLWWGKRNQIIVSKTRKNGKRLLFNWNSQKWLKKKQNVKSKKVTG